MLEFRILEDKHNYTQSIVLNKGGFWRFVIPKIKPPLPIGGALGELEFRDGRGYIGQNNLDLGKSIVSFGARSGYANGKASTIAEGKGHIPGGWYIAYRRKDITRIQSDLIDGEGETRTIRQGAYVRWYQDDVVELSKRYKTNYIYNGALEHDRKVGLPYRIKFKWQLEPIPPDDASGRSHLQIHPDGKKDGTLGCIGIQQYDGCVKVSSMLNNFNQTNILVYIQSSNDKK